MPDSARQVLKARVETHSDAADSKAVTQHQENLASRQLGDQLLRCLREARADVKLTNFREERLAIDDGTVYEVSVEVDYGERQVALGPESMAESDAAEAAADAEESEEVPGEEE